MLATSCRETSRAFFNTLLVKNLNHFLIEALEVLNAIGAQTTDHDLLRTSIDKLTDSVDDVVARTSRRALAQSATRYKGTSSSFIVGQQCWCFDRRRLVRRIA